MPVGGDELADMLLLALALTHHLLDLDLVLTAEPVEDAADRTGIAETDYPLRFGWAPLKSIRSDGMKYIEAPRPEFYELAKDPKELANSYEPWNQNVQKLRAVLADFHKSVAQQKSVSAGTVPQQTIDELKALGYLGSNPGATTAAEPSLLPDPKDKIQVQNLLHTAMLADEDNKPQAARSALKAALKLDPKTPAALVQLGQLELTKKHFSRAAELLARARERQIRVWGAPTVVNSPQFAFMAQTLARRMLGTIAAARADYGHTGPDWSAFFYEEGAGPA